MNDSIDYSTWIGARVSKSALKQGTQPKPFKSKKLVNTVKSLTVNPNTGKPAFTFHEDESIVDCYICSKIT